MGQSKRKVSATKLQTQQKSPLFNNPWQMLKRGD